MSLKNHQSAIESNSAFMVKIEDLVREIVIQNSIPYYRIESKMDLHTQTGGEDIYLPIIRIITYFEDTVNPMCDLLRDEFDIAIEKSIDKKRIKVDTFSYKHVQYIAGLRENRRELTEYKRYGNKKFEIQICSMLQDAWGGIEKELGYDGTVIPEEAKRDFYRVGALLEMADIEFCKIRSQLGKEVYRTSPIQLPETVMQDSAEEIAASATANTFAEHLQAVVKEVPAQVVANAIPEVPEQQAVIANSIPAIEEVIAEAKKEPLTVPMQEKPLIVPVAAIEEEPKKATLAHTAFSSIIPQKAIPTVKRVGLAPQRVKAPEVKALGIESIDMNIDSLKSVAVNVTNVENTNTNTPVDKVSQLINSVVQQPEKSIPVPPPAPAPIPQVTIPVVTVPQMPVVNVPQTPVVDIPPVPVVAAPQIVVPEPPAPVVAVTPEPAPQPVVTPVPEIPVAATPATPAQESVALNIDNVHNFNMNVNGMLERTIETKTEIIRETEKAAEKAQERPLQFFDEQPKPAKPILDENAPMTDASLKEYVMNSKLLKEIDQKIAERAGAKINAEIDIEGDVERLRFLKVFTLKQLHDRLTDNKNDIVAFAEKWIGKDNGGSFDSGISLFYLEYLLVGKKNDPAFAIEYVVKFISDNDYSARYIIPTYNSIRNTEVSNFSHLTLKA